MNELRANTAVALGLLLAAGAWPAWSADAARGPERPSVVFILSDDADLASHRAMAKTKALVEDRGAVFDNYFVSYSFCCPSRTTILRGQYPHNHRIEGNDLPTGGYGKFKALALGDSTVATWLDDAGYHTAFLGKLMNGYEAESDSPLGRVVRRRRRVRQLRLHLERERHARALR
jgi:N-acetylglucosamine-6-sulfatase